jgi:hypothetical protein
MKMPTKSYAIEERVIKASKAMDNDPTLKGTAAAAKFGAPYDRLMARGGVDHQATLEEGRTRSSLRHKIMP